MPSKTGLALPSQVPPSFLQERRRHFRLSPTAQVRNDGKYAPVVFRGVG